MHFQGQVRGRHHDRSNAPVVDLIQTGRQRAPLLKSGLLKLLRKPVGCSCSCRRHLGASKAFALLPHFRAIPIVQIYTGATKQ